MRKKLLLAVAISIMVFGSAANSFAATTFSDVKESDWYFQSVDPFIAKGFMNGYEDGTFKPNNTITYAEFAKVMSLSSGLTVRDKAEGESWYTPYFESLNSLGISCNTLKPNDKLTRSDVASLLDLYLFNKVIYDDTKAKIFVDLYNGGCDLTNEMSALGIMTGTQGKDGLYFNGEKAVTRAEICTILQRMAIAVEKNHI